MEPMVKGALAARLAETEGEVAQALALRARVFRGGRADRDAWDDTCRHALILREGMLAATFRVQRLAASEIGTSYAGQRYDLTRLAARGGVLVELGRFCTDPGQRSADPIRLAWALATRLVDAWGAGFLFGCTSFPGTDPEVESAALGLLAARNLAPADWAPGIKSAEVFAIAGLPAPAEAQLALARLPPLLRSYLALGGRVSGHAVIDRDLGTFHLFTGLDIAAIPPARAAALRDLSR
jgi:putative hemolysin